MNTRPNIIVFLTDQQRWDTTGVHGNPLGLTPNFDRLAVGGTHFTNAFTCQPVCAPARSCIQTGRYATETGVYRNGVAMDPSLPTLASVFREAGYATGYIGKWHLSDEEPVPVEKRGGYEQWLGSNLLEFTSLPYETMLYDNEGEEVWLPGHRIDAITDASIRFIAEHSGRGARAARSGDSSPAVAPSRGAQAREAGTSPRDAQAREAGTSPRDAQARPDERRPFLLFVSHLEPHHQNQYDNYPAPDGYAERFKDPWTPPDLRALGGTAAQHLPGYYGMVKKLDEALGRTLDALKSLSMQENTIVWFTSDHGCHFKTRNSEYKRSCHEASIHLPSAVTGPGFRGGGQVPELLSLIDLAPTLIDAAGLEVPAGMQGRSALPLVAGPGRGVRAGAKEGRQAGAGPSAPADDLPWPREVYIQISESQVARAIRTSRWKYCVVARGKNPYEDSHAELYTEDCLYDLENDPDELCNLIDFASHREVAGVLRQKLLRKMEEAGEEPARIEEVVAVKDPKTAEGLPDWGRIQRTVRPQEVDL